MCTIDNSCRLLDAVIIVCNGAGFSPRAGGRESGEERELQVRKVDVLL